MRIRTVHPRLAAIACRVYGLLIWLYPPAFRRTFGRELILAFRSRVEDVLNDGGLPAWIAFAVHITWDTFRTAGGMLIAAHESEDAVSLLGLREGAAAHGAIEQAAVSLDVLFAGAGLVLGCGGWYAYFVLLPLYFV